MALQTLPNYIDYPSIPGTNNLGSLGYTQNGILMNAAGEYGAVILQVPPTFSGNITKIHFNCETAPTSGNLVLSVQTVNASGFPSGTDWSTNTNVTITAAASSGWQTGTLTSAAAIVPGDLIALKVQVDTGSSFSGYLSRAGIPLSNLEGGLVTGTYNDGTDRTTTYPHIFAELSDGTIIAFGTYVPQTDLLTNNVNTAGGGYGMKFTIPFKCRVVGMKAYINSVAFSTGDILFRLVDSDASTNLESVTIAAENLVQGNNQGGLFNAYFDTAVTLDKNDVVYVMTELGSGMTDTIQYYQHVVDGGTAATKWMDSFMSNATPCSVSGGTITAENRYHWYLTSLIIDQLDDGAGAGGGSGTVGFISVT